MKSKKFLTLFLSLSMVMSSGTATVFAAENQPQVGDVVMEEAALEQVGTEEAVANHVDTEESVAATTDGKTVIDGKIYATVNMEYADFLYGELNSNPADSATTAALAGDKAESYRTAGMYDAVTSATGTGKATGYGLIYYTSGDENQADEEVNTDATTGAVKNVTIHGVKDVPIVINADLYESLLAQTDKSHKAYEYLAAATYSDTAFAPDAEYKQLNADGTFSTMQTATVDDADAVVEQVTSTAWGHYQLNIANFGVDGVDASADNLYAIVVETADGARYGMLHSDNTWFRDISEFSWAIEAYEEPHGCHPAYARTADLKAGKTITRITYLLKDAADIVVSTNTALKTLVDEDTVLATAGTAVSNHGKIEIPFTFRGLDTIGNAVYEVSELVKGTHHGTTVDPSLYSYNSATGVLTLDESCEGGDDYVITFGNEKYADLEAVFSNYVDQSIGGESSFNKKYGDEAFDLGATAKGELTYASSNTEVATVDAAGKVTITGVGSADITVTAAASGAFKEATRTVKVTVSKAAGTVTVKKSISKTYGAKAFSLGAKGTGKLTYSTSNKKVATVSAAGKVTIKGAGKATITVTSAATDNYSKATAKVTLTVKPKKVASVKAVSKTAKKATVTWKKISSATGYEIKIGTNKGVTRGTKTYTVKSVKTVKKIIKSLKSGKTYYVKVRAYSTTGSKSKIYGSYSAVQKVKVK